MQLLGKLQALARLLTGRELRARPDLDCESVRLGTDYGGWHVAPRGLDAGSVVYSFGVGEDVSFDLALIERFGATVHAFDPTPRSIAWVRAQGLPARFVMHEVGIAGVDGEAAFHPPENPAHVSHTLLDRPSTKAHAISLPVKRLATIMRELGHARVDLLKLDIEGAEYAVIEDLAGTDLRPRQLLVEFHHRFPGVGARRTKDALARLRAMGYRLFAVSATGEEFSFLHGSALP